MASKDIIAKCEAEDIPGVTNHMSTVSLGLAATVREWFGESADESATTSVETAPPVNINEARAKAKKRSTKKKAAKKKAAAKKTTETEADDAAKVATETDEPATPGDATPTLTPAEQPAEPTEAEEHATPQTPDEQRPAAAAASEPSEAKPQGRKSTEQHGERKPAPESKRKEPAQAEPNVPKKPEVKPAGPMLEQPEKTQLAGPKVIRVETPDVVSPPRSRSRTDRGGGGGPGMAPPSGPSEGAPGRGGGGRRSTTSRRNKRRSASAGEGRSGRGGTEGGERSFNWREQDLREREARLSKAGGYFKAARRDNLKRTAGGGHRAATAAESGGSVRIEEPITVKSLSAATGLKAADILKKAILMGKPMNINSAMDAETAQEIVLEHNIELEVVEQKSAEQQIEEQFKQRDVVDERPRSPVITILGHVDHGKTSLLDKIRRTNVAAGEAGGITQATSAFRVPVHVGENEHQITFIDTPGHEAFTEMRARGAIVTDIVVLVVAADDGVMPQTVESINHAKAAGVPIVVALNKIDKPEATDANIQRILGQLAEYELNPVEWGGQTEVVRTSAINDQGIHDLLEVLDFQAQLLELKADFGGKAEGTVIESAVEEGRGPVASVLIQQGQLKKGDFITCGRAYGRVRDIINDRGERIDQAGPCTPVAISGLNEVPDAGDRFYIVDTLKGAEAAAEERRDEERHRELSHDRVTLDNIFDKLAESERKELPLVVKADVQGSVDTLKAALEKLSTDEITIAIKHTAVGGINESDVALAEASGAIIIGFNVTTSSKVRKMAEARRVDIRLYDVIYDITDDVTKAAEGMLEPEYKLEVLGHAEVREVFKITKIGMVAGCYVTDGVIERNAQIRVTRNEIVIEKDRRLEQLKRFKDDVKEVRAGQECGMRIQGYDDIQVGDVLECYKTREVRRKLSETRQREPEEVGV